MGIDEAVNAAPLCADCRGSTSDNKEGRSVAPAFFDYNFSQKSNRLYLDCHLSSKSV